MSLRGRKQMMQSGTTGVSASLLRRIAEHTLEAMTVRVPLRSPNLRPLCLLTACGGTV